MTWYTVQCGYAGYFANTVSIEADTLEEALSARRFYAGMEA